MEKMEATKLIVEIVKPRYSSNGLRTSI